ncbi:hypothetical protein [Pseudolactococcus laudensis]|uniref:hypothetical protein n=1 Tax=Pseudolactococcus laudensis TaxID=1494461 RepID=UPI003F9CD048
MNYMTHTIEPWMPVGATKPKDDIAKIAKKQGWMTLEIDRATQKTTANNLTAQLISSFTNSLVISLLNSKKTSKMQSNKLAQNSSS